MSPFQEKLKLFCIDRGKGGILGPLGYSTTVHLIQLKLISGIPEDKNQSLGHHNFCEDFVPSS